MPTTPRARHRGERLRRRCPGATMAVPRRRPGCAVERVEQQLVVGAVEARRGEHAVRDAVRVEHAEIFLDACTSRFGAECRSDASGRSRRITCAWQSIASTGVGTLPEAGCHRISRRSPAAAAPRSLPAPYFASSCDAVRKRCSSASTSESAMISCSSSNETSASGRSTDFPLSSDCLQQRESRLHAAQRAGGEQARIDDRCDAEILQLRWPTGAALSSAGGCRSPCSPTPASRRCARSCRSARPRARHRRTAGRRPPRRRDSGGASPRRAPCVASTSVRDLITKSGSTARLAPRRGSSAPSPRRR